MVSAFLNMVGVYTGRLIIFGWAYAHSLYWGRGGGRLYSDYGEYLSLVAL